MYKDRHARVDRVCENCGNDFTARVERVNNGQGRFCSLKCANEFQRKSVQDGWGFENGKPYFSGGKWIVQWRDSDGIHNTSYARWWWTLNVGEIPEGYVVSLKDRNQENVDPSNFEIVPKGRIWVENGKGNKARTGLKWSDEQKVSIGNRVSRDWESGKYDRVKGETHHNWKGGASKEEYPKEFYKIREFILDRDKYQCRVCGRSLNNSKFRHVHHRDADKKNNSMDNLISLCIHCHGQVHSKKPTSSESIMALRSELDS